MSTMNLEAAPEDVGLSSAKLRNLSAWAERLVAAKLIPGAITMVARHGQLVHFETTGNMDDEAGKPMQKDTIFRIFSMTKPIVSLALMLLYEEGRFQLDDPASKFIPSWKNLKVFAGGTPEKYETRDPAREVTVRDLLMHTGGAPGLYGISPEMDALMNPVQHIFRNGGVETLAAPPETLARMAEKMAALPLHVDPGSKWIYGFATDMVGYLVEIISGQPLDRFVDGRILQPLGMVDTAFSVPKDKLDRFSACYRLGKTGEPAYVHSDSPATSPFARQQTFFSGVAGLLSTASDYMRFAKMLANGGELDGHRIVGARTIELMATNHLPDGVELHEMALGPMPVAKGTGFGLGFGVLLDPAANQTLGTPGEYYWGGAASTAFFVSPVDDLVAIFMTQLLLGQPHQFPRYLRVLSYQALLD